jgi:ParB-like chromosome segregation protein Spo0J
VELEFQQLDRRYEGLRTRDAAREKRLLASLSTCGQQVPIVVVHGSAGVVDRFVVVDGYKRIRALRRLAQDTVQSTCWDLSEPDALIVHRLLSGSAPPSVLEQAWLLSDLSERFRLRPLELARRFDRSVSWVSRRLGLVHDLPQVVQDKVRAGEVVPHAAMKYLLPLARANASDCLRLLEGLCGQRLSSRAMGRVYAAYMSTSEESRERLLSDPLLFLRVDDERQRAPVDPSDQTLADLRALSAIAARTARRLSVCVELSTPARDEGTVLITRAASAVERIVRLWKERTVAG